MTLETFWKSLLAASERVGRSRVRRELIMMSDRTIADLGMSRERLEEGVAAWPWSAPADDTPTWKVGPVPVDEPTLTEAEIARAAQALHEYTDAQLADLGVARGRIEEAVRNGRPGIDDVRRRHAA